MIATYQRTDLFEKIIKIHNQNLHIALNKTLPIQIPKKLTAEIELITSMGEEHRQKLGQAAADFRTLMEITFPDASIWMTGSFAAGVDLPSSDLDFTLKVPSLGEKPEFAKLKAIRAKLSAFRAFRNVFLTGGSIPVLKMVHTATDVDIDVTIDNEAPKKNTMLLAVYGQMDERFSKLCRGVKKWAADSGVENSRMGRVNSFSICLLFVHYLQQVGVLPKELPSIDGSIETISNWKFKEEIGWVSQNKDSLGALLWGFMRYYSQFDFVTQWISIRQGKALEKRRDEEGDPLDGLPRNNLLIVVEDPFLVPAFNCARSLRQCDIYHRIVEEFVEAEKTIREKSRFPSRKSIGRVEVEKDGKSIDSKIKEIEYDVDLDQEASKSWE
uniref:PAP-associated domain-containing protein n=1 Tax=Caenorhabditis tropicalis TaxID=1561998 RepID=A0A1I7TJ93_9PELO